MESNRFFPEIHGNLGFGCMRLPMDGARVDAAQMQDMADVFLNAGFNYFDTAHGYVNGLSETAIRDAVVKRYDRTRFVLADKLSTHFFNRADQLPTLFQSQLTACGVSYFDFYLMHAQDQAIYEKFRRCHAYEFSLRMQREGKIRHFGISFHDKAEVLEKILTEYPQIEVVQLQFNYVDYENASVESRKCYEVCERFGKPVLVMEPVKGGSLVHLPADAQKILDGLGGGYSNAGYALRFAASFPNIYVVLSGMSDLMQMQDNVAAMRNFQPLSEREREAVRQVQAVFSALRMIPCTACHYCVYDNDCPKNIPIPELFSCYNLKTTFHNWNQDYYYNNVLTKSGGRASACVRCGKCELVCPQHLEIRKLLEEVAAEFER